MTKYRDLFSKIEELETRKRYLMGITLLEMQLNELESINKELKELSKQYNKESNNSDLLL